MRAGLDTDFRFRLARTHPFGEGLALPFLIERFPCHGSNNRLRFHQRRRITMKHIRGNGDGGQGVMRRPIFTACGRLATFQSEHPDYRRGVGTTIGAASQKDIRRNGDGGQAITPPEAFAWRGIGGGITRRNHKRPPMNTKQREQSAMQWEDGNS